MKYKLVNTEQIFVDATHVKACANSKKMRKRVAHEQALWYEEELNKEIEKDRLAHEKKPLKKKDDNPLPASGGTGNDKDSRKRPSSGSLFHISPKSPQKPLKSPQNLSISA